MRKLLAFLLSLLVCVGAHAAFPTVVSESNSEEEAIDQTTHTMSLPGSLISGNDIVCAAVVDGNWTSVTDPSGFTKLIAVSGTNPVTGGSNAVHGVAWHKVSNGSEGATITFATGGGQRSEHKCWQLAGHDSSTNAPQIATSTHSSGVSLNPDPPSLTPTGGAKDYLWLTIAGKDNGGDGFSGFPTSYTGTGASDQAAFNSAGVAIGWARRAVNGASEDPSAFTYADMDSAVLMTIAVHPGAEGSVPASNVFNPMTGRGGAAAQPITLLRRAPANDDHFVTLKRVAGL